MRWTTAATTGILAAALAACGPKANRPGAETGTANDTAGAGMPAMPSDSNTAGSMTGGGVSSDSTMTGGTGQRDTAMTGMSRDTGPASPSSDTGRMPAGKANQSESGVTNSKSKSSTLGPGATKTRPDQGQPVTSKGDTISRGTDSTSR